MATGAKLFIFEGHDAPVHSVCPHCKENVHVRDWLDTSLLLIYILQPALVDLLSVF